MMVINPSSHLVDQGLLPMERKSRDGPYATNGMHIGAHSSPQQQIAMVTPATGASDALVINQVDAHTDTIGYHDKQ